MLRWLLGPRGVAQPPQLGLCIVCRDPVQPDQEHVVMRSAVAHATCALYRPRGLGF